MKKIILVLLFPLFNSAQNIIQIEPIDDKFYHAQAGQIMTCFFGSSVDFFSYRYTHNRNTFIGISSSVGITIAKELVWDKALHKGTPSTLDAISGIKGALVGGICLRIGFDLNEKKYQNRYLFE